jgi:hypothetical protein
MNLFEETFIKHRNLTLQNQLNEIFVIEHRRVLKNELMAFLKKQFESGNLKAVRGGISVTEYKPNDWLEPMAENVLNHMASYFETIRSQTERNIYPSVQIVKN